MDFLAQAKVHEIVAPKEKLHDVAASTPISEVLILLEKRQILSVPIFDAPGRWVDAGGNEVIVGNKQYIGIVSVLDIITYAFRECTTALNEANSVLSRPVSSAIGSTDESLSIWMETINVHDAMEQFAKGVHRALVLPVLENSADEVKLLTQTDVVTFLSGNQAKSALLDRVFNSKLKDLNRPDQTKDIVNVSMSDNLIDALNVLLESKVHGVAVVGDGGKLQSVLSVSDLRGMVASRLPSLRFLTVSDFLRQRELRTYDEPLSAPFTCTPEDRLKDVAETMLQFHFHMVWIIDYKDQPTDVLTLTDIINIIRAS
jgi:CBS domain-containing protein